MIYCIRSIRWGGVMQAHPEELFTTWDAAEEFRAKWFPPALYEVKPIKVYSTADDAEEDDE